MFLRRRYRRKKGRKRRVIHTTRSHFFLTLLVSLLVAGGVIGCLEARMAPAVAALAQVQAQNQVRSLVEETVATCLDDLEIGYGSLVTIERKDTGEIAALISNPAELNLLRSRLTELLWQELGSEQLCVVHVPVGNLLQSEFTWGKGPDLVVEVVAIGGVSAEFHSEFQAAGVNQTMHKITLDLSIPIALMLPGGRKELSADVALPVAETVIVGQIPDTYLQLTGLPATG